LYIKALGHQKLGDLEQANSLLEQLLSEQEDHFQARLRLANIYIEQKKYEQSLAQLNTLKATSANTIIATEIELAYSKIKMANKKYDEVITDLQAFQSNHLNISAVKKSKIQLQIGSAYVELGKGTKAMKAFKLALINIDEQRFPLLYARSYFGQGRVMITQEINEDVFELFEKARKYAILAGNLHYQILSLNSLAEMYLSSFQWEKSIAAVEQLVELSELDNDSQNYAKGLSSLVAILNQRGHFTRAREINNKLEVLANKTGSDNTLLIFLFYDAILAMNAFEWEHAQQQIDRNYEIALRSKNYSVLLNNAFIALELRLLKDDLDDFKELWDDRVAFINEHGFGRIQVYMDFYLARYYKQKKQTSKAIEILNQVSKQANENNDVKMLVDAQNQLAEIYLETDAKKSLDILNKLEQHNPNPNPHLGIKAKALNKLGQNIQALSVLNQAKLVYSESWTAENEAFLISLQE
jgi:predicted negative regulator of RcsB-dependent stress response